MYFFYFFNISLIKHQRRFPYTTSRGLQLNSSWELFVLTSILTDAATCETRIQSWATDTLSDQPHSHIWCVSQGKIVIKKVHTYMQANESLLTVCAWTLRRLLLSLSHLVSRVDSLADCLRVYVICIFFFFLTFYVFFSLFSLLVHFHHILEFVALHCSKKCETCNKRTPTYILYYVPGHGHVDIYICLYVCM